MSEEVLSYKAKSGNFEGPLGLLLSFIENRKLFINEVSLAQVTDDYISYLKNLQDLPSERKIADISYFVIIAATLILIKSKSLLPDLSLTDDETEKINNLEKRLKLYQIIKNASISIKENFGVEIIFAPEERNWSEPIFSPDPQITVKAMGEAIETVIFHLPKKEVSLPEIEIVKAININEVIESLTLRIQDAMNISFREFSKSHGAQNEREARVHVIVSFLAMLELVRGGIIDVIQNGTYEDMQISKQEVLVDNQE